MQAGFQYACALTHHHQDAEDLVQAAWLKLYQRYGEVTTLNDERTHSQEADVNAAEDPGVTLEQLLTRLRDIEREALFLHVVEGYYAGEIAALTGRPRGSVLSLIHRSRKKLAALAATESRTS